MPLVKTIANFSIEYNQILNEAGVIQGDTPPFVDDPKLLVSLYENMVLTRVFDTKAIALQRTGRLGTYPSSLGQEAIAVAIGKAMYKDDVFCPYYREYGAHFQRGVSMEETLLFWGGDERGSNFKNNSQDLPHCIPIASQYLHAAGVAAAMKLRKEQRCAVAAVGEGGTSEGDFYEAINLAGAWNLPAVFIVNNNQWAISVSREVQTKCETIAQKGIAAGIKSVQVDGNDVLGLYDVIKTAVDNARSGQGPILIEAITYRLCDHTTADDASRYRDNEEVKQAEKNEPIKRMRTFLEAQKIWNGEQESQLIKRCQEKVEQAVANYENMPPQPPESMFDSLYETLPEIYYEQRDEIGLHAEDLA